MQEIIKRYFNMWLHTETADLDSIFAENAVYSECYGPEYFGIDQISKWYQEWNKHGKVVRWDIKQILEQGNICAVEWYFECIYEKEQSGFDGVSLIEFNEEGKIISVKEFESKADHYYPMGQA